MLNFGALPSHNDAIMGKKVDTSSSSLQNDNDESRLHEIQQNIRFINLSLQKMNMETPFPFPPFTTNPTPTESELLELERASTILIDLVNSKQRENSFRKEFGERYSNLERDLNSRDEVIKKFYLQLEGSENDLKSSEKKIIILQEKLCLFEKRASQSENEVLKLKSILLKKEKSYSHELKRREMEFDRLKVQLQRLIHEPSASNISTLTKRSYSSSAELNPSLFVDDSMVVNPGQRNDRLETLENENANLRQLISSLNTVLGQMKLQNPSISQIPQDHSEQLGILPISWVYDMVREEIEASLEAISEIIHKNL